jgi:hypothetical protein
MEGLWHRMNIRHITAGIYPYDNNFTRDVLGKGRVCQFGVTPSLISFEISQIYQN